jgi:hypothetical protein
MRRALATLAAAGLVLLGQVAQAASAPAANPFAQWAAVVISGDNEAAHVDRHTEAFDNARRDVGHAFQRRGFSEANMAEFSVEPGRHPDTAPRPAHFGISPRPSKR